MLLNGAAVLQALMEAADNAPETPCNQLPLLSRWSRSELLKFNPQPETNPANECIHELFEAAAAQHAERPCLRGTPEPLSYKQVDEQANQLAHFLSSMSVSKEAPVGIMLERSNGLYIAMLAVLKAGRCYCPLDSSYPAERLAVMAEDSGMSILINQQNLISSSPASKAQVSLSSCSMFQDHKIWHCWA